LCACCVHEKQGRGWAEWRSGWASWACPWAYGNKEEKGRRLAGQVRARWPGTEERDFLFPTQGF